MSKSNHTGRDQYLLVSGDTYTVWADDHDQAKQKLYDIRFNVVGCPICPTEDCDCVEEVGYLTTTISVNGTEDDRTARIVEALNADALLQLAPTDLRQRITEIIEGTK